MGVCRKALERVGQTLILKIMSTKNILVLVPGTTGSTLVSYDNTPVWPDTVLATELDDKDDPSTQEFKTTLAVMTSEVLKPGMVMLNTLDGPSSYQGFVDYFTSTDNFSDPSDVFTDYYPQYSETGGVTTVKELKDSDGQEVQSLADNSLIAFAYDWRQDNIKNGESLQNMLQFIDGMVDGSSYKIYLVGHSMGGLVSRSYLEIVGKADSWHKNVQLLITVATPHYGAPLALSAISDQLPTLQNVDIANFAEKLVDFNGLSSSYQLLPSDQQAAFVDCNGTDYSIYSNSPNGLNDVLIDADYKNANGTTPDPASADNFEANTSFYSQLDPTSLSDSYRCIYAINSGDTITGFTYVNGQSGSGIQKGGVLSPVGAASAGDTIVPLTSAVFEPVVSDKDIYQAMTDDPKENKNLPWTVGEPNHVNIIGRTDVLDYIKSQIGTD